MDRRQFLLAFTTLLLGLGSLAMPALAKDGGKGDGGKGEGKGGDGGGDSHGGGEGEGEGSGSGSGGGDSGGKGSGHSGDDGGDGDDDNGASSETEAEHEEATEAVRKGEVLSYRDVMQRLRKDQVGRVLRVELDRSARRPVYRMRIEDEAGFVSTVMVDARTGRLMRPGER